MTGTLLRALILLAVASALCAWAIVRIARRTTLSTLLQLVGACGLLAVGLTHLCEAQQWLSFMHWGSPHSAGHYLDFASALLALTLLTSGFVLQLLARRSA
jgi:hypothetical protein